MSVGDTQEVVICMDGRLQNLPITWTSQCGKGNTESAYNTTYDSEDCNTHCCKNLKPYI